MKANRATTLITEEAVNTLESSEMSLEQINNHEKYAKKDREWQWKGWLELEHYHNAVPICMGASGSLYAHGIPYGKGTKAKDFAALLGKLICFDDLTQIIEYDIEQRSEWE